MIPSIMTDAMIIPYLCCKDRVLSCIYDLTKNSLHGSEVTHYACSYIRPQKLFHPMSDLVLFLKFEGLPIAFRLI